MAVFGYFAYSGAETGVPARELKKREGAQQGNIKRYCRRKGWEVEAVFRDLGGKWSVAFERGGRPGGCLGWRGRGTSSSARPWSACSVRSAMSAKRSSCCAAGGCGCMSARWTAKSPPMNANCHSAACSNRSPRWITAGAPSGSAASNPGNGRQGRYLGGNRPFGYMVHQSGRLIENPMEQNMIRRMLQLRELGWSLRAIAGKVARRRRRLVSRRCNGCCSARRKFLSRGASERKPGDAEIFATFCRPALLAGAAGAICCCLL